MNASNRRSVSVASIIAAALIFSLAVGGFVVYAEYEAIRPDGSWALLSASMFAVLPLLLCIIGAPVAAAFCIPKWSRTTAAAVFLSCLLVVGSIHTSMGMGRDLRRKAFIALAERSAVLIDAIKAYEDKYGEPPASLETLVPDFIPSIPTTDMGAYPRYKYVVPEQGRYAGNLGYFSFSPQLVFRISTSSSTTRFRIIPPIWAEIRWNEFETGRTCTNSRSMM